MPDHFIVSVKMKIQGANTEKRASQIQFDHKSMTVSRLVAPWAARMRSISYAACLVKKVVTL